MKLTISIVLTFFSLLCSAQRSPLSPTLKKLRNDTIIWKQDSLLRAEDFKAKPKKNGPLGWSSLGLFLYYTESGGELMLSVEALFVKSKSYLAKNTEYVLKHEQIHFDIAELYARKLRKKLDEIDFKKIKDMQKEVNKHYDKLVKEYMKEQEDYDQETEHGLNSAKQKVWDEKISAAIKELEKYSVYTVSISS